MPAPKVTVRDAGVAESEKFGTEVTVSITVEVWVTPPLMPVMVRVKVPAGVELEVEMFSVEEPEPPRIAGGVKVPVAPAGRPVTLSATSLLKAPTGATLTV